jgi:hypothetical protein
VSKFRSNIFGGGMALPSRPLRWPKRPEKPSSHALSRDRQLFSPFVLVLASSRRDTPQAARPPPPPAAKVLRRGRFAEISD